MPWFLRVKGCLCLRREKPTASHAKAIKYDSMREMSKIENFADNERREKLWKVFGKSCGTNLSCPVKGPVAPLGKTKASEQYLVK